MDVVTDKKLAMASQRHQDPVPDGKYKAQLSPIGSRQFSYQARIIAPIDPSKRVRSGGIAYIHLRPSRHFRSYDSSLTTFLKTHGLYRRGMTEKQRILAARKFAETRPYVGVCTVWVGYSHKKRKTVLSGMHQFPVRPDGSHNPDVVIDGEKIRATAHVQRCVALSDPEWSQDERGVRPSPAALLHGLDDATSLQQEEEI